MTKGWRFYTSNKNAGYTRWLVNVGALSDGVCYHIGSNDDWSGAAICRHWWEFGRIVPPRVSRTDFLNWFFQASFQRIPIGFAGIPPIKSRADSQQAWSKRRREGLEVRVEVELFIQLAHLHRIFVIITLTPPRSFPLTFSVPGAVG